MLYAIVGLLFLLADQFLKFWTVAHIELNAYPGKELIPGVLNLTYIKNAGAAFGLFSDSSVLRWVLLGLLIAFTAFIVIGLATRYLRTGFARWTGTLLLAGLLGNGIDRAIYGYVVDMLEPKLGSISWPIFNLADCLAVVFGILFCIALLAGGFGAPYRFDEDEEDEEEEEERPRRRRRVRDEEEDEDEAEEEEAPVRRRHPREEAPTRRHHHARSEEEHDRPVRRRSRPEKEDDAVEAPAPARRRPVAQEAEAAVRAARGEAPESEASVRTVERPAPVKPAPSVESKPVAKAEPKSAPAAESKSAPKAEPKSAPKTESADEFDLDSILAEFK